MIAHGLEPSQFVISKDAPRRPRCRSSGRSSTTTPCLRDDSFTVTEPNDDIFLDYFLQRCIAEEEPAPLPARAPA